MIAEANTSGAPVVSIPDDDPSARARGAECGTIGGPGAGEAAGGEAGNGGVRFNLPAIGAGRRVIRLSAMRVGQTGSVCGTELDVGDAALLRAMGMCSEAWLRVCRRGSPVIVLVGCGCKSACRIGLAGEMAERILITLDPE